MSAGMGLDWALAAASKHGFTHVGTEHGKQKLKDWRPFGASSFEGWGFDVDPVAETIGVTPAMIMRHGRTTLPTGSWRLWKGQGLAAVAPEAAGPVSEAPGAQDGHCQCPACVARGCWRPAGIPCDHHPTVDAELLGVPEEATP